MATAQDVIRKSNDWCLNELDNAIQELKQFEESSFKPNFFQTTEGIILVTAVAVAGGYFLGRKLERDKLTGNP